MFKLEFNIPSSPPKINLKEGILLTGSCFSDEIGNLLKQNKCRVTSNPFGTIYNPHSIFSGLRNDQKADNITESQGVFYHWDTHGKISGLTKEDAKTSFNLANDIAISAIENSKWLIITLGTAIVYKLESTGDIVANCHKIESSAFKKEFLTTDNIVSDFEKTYDHLKNVNPELNILLTVSPVRHIKDGLVDNSRSKSILLESVHRIISKNSDVNYFPSYEIMIDELRDYRFYKKDMIHPSQEAIEYVWERFCETYFDQETLDFLSEWSKIKSAIHHKPFQPQSPKHQQFLKDTLQKVKALNDLVDTRVEIEMLTKQLQ